MKPFSPKMKTVLAFVVGAVLASGPVMAEKPSWAGAGKGGKDQRTEQRDGQRGDQRSEQRGERRDDGGKSRHDGDRSPSGKRGHFEERHQVIVREYYTEQFRSGRCPPGLAKKHNGCMPPGQAKKWEIGRPLPRELIYYSVPQQLVVQIGPPPSGYRYVRVASDILMIAIGTGLVIDAIQDLSR